MSDSSNAVFLSYASQDAAAAARICAGLRAAGVEVWFDQSELRGGDSWDQKIKDQIQDCVLFLPVISAHTQARLEGYFRREWKLAVARTYDMADEKPFLVPVVIDETLEQEASVPAQFRAVQWTRLLNGETSPGFCTQVKALLAGEGGVARATASSHPARFTAPARAGRRWLVLVGAVVLMGAVAVLQPWRLLQGRVETNTRASATPRAAEKSVAVLPFIDLSERKDEGYFADGISEELIAVIAREPQIKVPARTSSFYFRNRQATVSTIATALGVTHLLEGSVRKSGNIVRITVELIRADTGFHVWSQIYDRPLTDIFKVQDEIAASVARSLEVSLLGSRTPIAPPSVNPAAYTLYLRARTLAFGGRSEDFDNAIKAMEQALALDPTFAAGWAMLADILTADLDWHANAEHAAHCARARRAVGEALRLDSRSSPAHQALATIYRYCDNQLNAAEAEYKLAIALDPANSAALRALAYHYTGTNRPRQGLELAARAADIDPLNPWVYIQMAFAQGTMGKLAEAEQSYRKALEVAPGSSGLHALLANALLAEGHPQEAFAENAKEADEDFRMMNAPLVLDALGRKSEAQAAFDADMALYPDDYNAAVFYGCRRDADRALSYLRRRPEGALLWDVPNRLNCLKQLDGDPRFQALWKAQKLPPRDY